MSDDKTTPQQQNLDELIARSKERLAAMTEEERQAMRQAQRESFVRGMTTPCEHGILDFEQCQDCRNTAPQQHLRHSTHHVHRGPESLPCYCAASSDHSIGQEQTHPPLSNQKSMGRHIQFHNRIGPDPPKPMQTREA